MLQQYILFNTMNKTYSCFVSGMAINSTYINIPEEFFLSLFSLTTGFYFTNLFSMKNNIFVKKYFLLITNVFKFV